MVVALAERFTYCRIDIGFAAAEAQLEALQAALRTHGFDTADGATP